MTYRLISIAAGIAIIIVAGSIFLGNTIQFDRNVQTVSNVTMATSTRPAYPNPKKILIVPGHDNTDGGAVYKTAYESNLTRQLGEKLYNYLARDERFFVLSTRLFDSSNKYDPQFQGYFDNQKEEVAAFLKEHKQLTNAQIASGTLTTKTYVSHNVASNRAVNILYGVNKWANEHEMDLVLHIHFNNDVRYNMYAAGIQSGFAIYTPEEQMPNYKPTIDISNALYAQLKRFINPSTLPVEKNGMVPSQDLIAIGAYGTRTGPSILIEYGYIYEPRYADPKLQDESLDVLAYATYLGLIDFYFPTSTAVSK